MTKIHTTEGFDEYEIDGEPVRVICIDAPFGYQVLAFRLSGGLQGRDINGYAKGTSPIVKQKRKSRVVWITENESRSFSSLLSAVISGKTIKFVEEPNDE